VRILVDRVIYRRLRYGSSPHAVPGRDQPAPGSGWKGSVVVRVGPVCRVDYVPPTVIIYGSCPMSLLLQMRWRLAGRLESATVCRDGVPGRCARQEPPAGRRGWCHERFGSPIRC